MSLMRIAGTVLIGFPSLAQTPTISPNMWETAARQIIRLNPAQFPELPKAIATVLQRRGCTVPQTPMINGRHNVIKGEFLKPAQTDWAVLCSVGGVSSVLIFWNGSAVSPAQIAKRNDVDRLQGWGGNKIVFSSVISPVGREYILEHYRAYGAEKPPPIDH